MNHLSYVVCIFLTHSLYASEKPNHLLNTTQTEPVLKVDLPELRKIQLKLQSYNFLSLNFEQTIFKKLRKKTLKNNGEVYFKKPDSFRWKFTKTDQEEWIYDGQTLLHYFPKSSKAYRYKSYAAKGKNLKEIVNIVLDFDSLLKRYNVTSSDRDKNIVSLSLSPKETGEITQVQLTLDVDKNFIRKIVLDFDGGNQSSFVFSTPNRQEKKDAFSLSSKVKILDPV